MNDIPTYDKKKFAVDKLIFILISIYNFIFMILMSKFKYFFYTISVYYQLLHIM